MRVEIVNATDYRDSDLKAIVRAAVRAVGAKVKVLKLTVGRSRLAVSGQCPPTSKGLWAVAPMYLGLGVHADLRSVVAMALHEALHLIGADHASMTQTQRTCSGPLPAWAEGLALRLAEPRPEPGQVQALEAKLGRARAALKRAVTRSRRAATIEAKWRKRVKMLEARSEKLARALERAPDELAEQVEKLEAAGRA